MLKIRKGDKVVVNVGKDIGKKGTVIKILKKKSFFANCYIALVEGINICKKSVKGNPSKEQVAGIIEREFPINYSNISIFNDSTGKKDKIFFKILENGQKVRCYKSTGEVVKNA